MNTKIYIMTHKPFQGPNNPIYQPLHVGREGKSFLGYPGDNTGNHISDKNPNYCELTGIYWVWKNDSTSDYVGTAHYRRYLLKDHENVLSETDIHCILEKYDVITTKLLTLDYSYYDAFHDRHNQRDLDITGDVILELYPEYYPLYQKLVHENRTYFANMFVMKKQLFHEYCQFLFDILFEVEKRVDLSGYDNYQKRLFGFISEFLLYVWTTYHAYRVYHCQVGMISEKAETAEVKKQLAHYFKQQDISGAKSYFMECYEKRPDILMEASDLNNELKLAMQAISTFEHELQQYGHCNLNPSWDFQKIITYFRTLNAVIQKKHDISKIPIFIEVPPSAIAIQISQLLCQKQT